MYVYIHLFSVCKFHLKKLEGRRLDFDYRRSSKKRTTEVELRQALDKYEESKELAKSSMFNLLENDVRKLEKRHQRYFFTICFTLKKVKWGFSGD